MKDFEYLSSSITPTVTEWWITMVIGLVVAIGLIVFFQMNDVFDEEDHRNNGGIFSSWSAKRGYKGKRMPLHHRIKRFFNKRPWEDDQFGPLG